MRRYLTQKTAHFQAKLPDLTRRVDCKSHRVIMELQAAHKGPSLPHSVGVRVRGHPLSLVLQVTGAVGDTVALGFGGGRRVVVAPGGPGAGGGGGTGGGNEGRGDARGQGGGRAVLAAGSQVVVKHGRDRSAERAQRGSRRRRHQRVGTQLFQGQSLALVGRQALQVLAPKLHFPFVVLADHVLLDPLLLHQRHGAGQPRKHRHPLPLHALHLKAMVQL